MLTDEAKRRSYDSHMTAKEITRDSIINDTIKLSEMVHNDQEEGGVYWTTCRCGGTYEIEDDELKGCEEHGCGLIVACNTCSLHIQVIVI